MKSTLFYVLLALLSALGVCMCVEIGVSYVVVGYGLHPVIAGVLGAVCAVVGFYAIAMVSETTPVVS